MNYVSHVTRGWKAFRIDSRGRLCYLFHAHDGSSLVQFDTWMVAKAKPVREAKGRRYRSGFHFLAEEHHIEKFNRLTKNKYVFLPVRVRMVRPKPRTAVGSWLARELYIPKPKELPHADIRP